MYSLLFLLGIGSNGGITSFAVIRDNHSLSTHDTANGLTKCIIAYLKLRGAFVTRLNTTGIYRADLKRYVPNTQKKGMGDVFATYKGVSIQVEVKIGRDRMSATQQRTKAEFEQSGGYYFIAKNFESFRQWLDSFIQ